MAVRIPKPAVPDEYLVDNRVYTDQRTFDLFSVERAVEFVDLVLGGLFFIGERGFQRGDALGERGLGVLRLGERGLPRGQSAHQRAVAIHIRRAGLVGFLVFGFVLDERGLQAGDPLM